MNELYFFTSSDFIKFIGDDGLGFFSEELKTITKSEYLQNNDSVLFINYEEQIFRIVEVLFIQYDYLIVSLDRERLEGESQGERTLIKENNSNDA